MQLIHHDVYRKNKDPFEDMSAKNVAVENLQTQIIDGGGLVLNNNKHVKKTFDETVSQFKKAFQFSKRVTRKDIQKNISKDNTDKRKSIDVYDNYYKAPQDNYEYLRDKQIKSKVSSVVAFNADDVVVLCSVDDKHTYCGKTSSSQDKMDVIVNENVVLTKAPSESSDEEYIKKSKQFMFTDSDLPDSDEIKEILISYPRPIITESFSELEQIEDSSQEESYQFLRRRSNKSMPVATIDLTQTQMRGIEKLPERFITRQRKPPEYLGIRAVVGKKYSAILSKSYLKEQEDQIDEEIMSENVIRLKTFEKTNKIESTSRKFNSNKHKEKIEAKLEKLKKKDAKSKFGRISSELERNNTKEDAAKTEADVEARLGSTSNTKTTRRTRNKNDSKTTVSQCKYPEKEKKTNYKRKFIKNKIKRSTSEIEVRRSRRQQMAKKKNNNDTIKAPISTLKKNIHEQSTVYNISSSSSESAKSLKRSLVDDSDVPSSKRTRSHNTANNNSVNNASLRTTPARVVNTQRVPVCPYIILLCRSHAGYASSLCVHSKIRAADKEKELVERLQHEDT